MTVHLWPGLCEPRTGLPPAQLAAPAGLAGSPKARAGPPLGQGEGSPRGEQRALTDGERAGGTSWKGAGSESWAAREGITAGGERRGSREAGRKRKLCQVRGRICLL